MQWIFWGAKVYAPAYATRKARKIKGCNRRLTKILPNVRRTWWLSTGFFAMIIPTISKKKTSEKMKNRKAEKGGSIYDTSRKNSNIKKEK